MARQRKETSSGNKRVRLSAEKRREHLLDATAGLVLEPGIDAVTMERVAEQAGTSPSLVYVYFANRHELLSELYRREATLLGRKVGAAFVSAAGFEDKIRAATTAYFDVVCDRGPILFRLLQSAAVQPLARQLQAEGHRGMEAWLGGLIATEYGLRPADARAAALIFVRALPGAVDLVANDHTPRRKAIELYIQIALGGLERLGGTHGHTKTS